MDRKPTYEELEQQVRELEKEVVKHKEVEKRFVDLKRTEAALRLSEERLRLSLEGTTDGIWDWNIKTDQVYFSPRYYTMLGYEPDEFPPTYENWRKLLHPEDAEAAEGVVRRAVEDHSDYAVEFRYKAKSGEWRWILGRGKAVELDKEGKTVRMAGSHTDITEHKQAEEALRESDEYLRIITNTSMDGFVVTDSGGKFLDVNEAYCQILGYSRDELLKMTVADVESIDTPDEIDERTTNATETESNRFETCNRRKDGRIIDVEVSMTSIQLKGLYLNFVRDITDRKRAEVTIRESEEKYRLLFETNEILLTVCDRRGVCQLMNRRVAALHGGEPKDFIGKSFKELHPKAGGDYIRRIQETIDLGISQEYEDEVEFFQGKRWLLTRMQPVPDAKGVFRTVQIISQDFTERKQAEEALRASQERLSLVIEGSNDGFWDWNVATGEAYFSPRYYTMLGYAPDEFPATYENWKSLIHPEDLTATEETLRQHFDEKLPTYVAELRLRTRSGDYRWILTRGKVVERDNEGKVVRMSGTHSDITERKQAEHALEKRIVALTKPLDTAEGIAFEDLFNLSEIQRLQDLYAKAFGVAALITRPDGTPITQPSNFSELCREIIRKNPKGVKNCNRSDAMIGRHNPSGPNIRPCLSAGLCNAGASITVGGQHVANWLIGQVRNEAQKEEEIMAYAHEIGADETAFRAAYRKVPIMSQEQFERAAHVLFEVANQISTTAYQNVQQARFIAERKRAEETLRKRETELEIQSHHLQEVNSALKVLLRQREEDKKELQESAVANVEELVFPYLEKLSEVTHDDRYRAYIKIIKSNLNDILSPFIGALSSKLTKLTPTEVQVANFIKHGKTTKEIAEMLNLSVETIKFHRKNIRDKVGIKNKKANLRTHLLSVQ